MTDWLMNCGGRPSPTGLMTIFYSLTTLEAFRSSHCQSQSYVTTDGQSASLPSYQTPSVAQDQILITVRQLWICWCEAPSLTRGRFCRLQLLLALAIADILGSKSRGAHDHIWLSQIRDSPNLEGQVPVFISPRNSVAQLYSQALGSLPYFSAFDSRLPQPVGPGPRIYIPQEQGGPGIPPGTGFPFRRLLRLARLFGLVI
jgi:hypothetical protein